MFTHFSNNEDASDCAKQRRSGMINLTVGFKKLDRSSNGHSPNSDGGSDENESSSGFGEDDVLNHASQLQQSTAENATDQVILPHTVVESIEVNDHCRYLD